MLRVFKRERDHLALASKSFAKEMEIDLGLNNGWREMEKWMKLTKVIGKELTRPVWALITPESSLERRGNNDGEAGWSQKGKCPLMGNCFTLGWRRSLGTREKLVGTQRGGTCYANFTSGKFLMLMTTINILIIVTYKIQEIFKYPTM